MNLAINILVKAGMERGDAKGLVWIAFCTWVAVWVVMFLYGVNYANRANDVCVIKKPIEVVGLAPLFLGCQMGKERFEIKLN